MKYLSEAFKSEFIDEKKEKSSGTKFEGLIFRLLKHYFPDYEWHDTPVTHDGSKDFYAQKEEYVYWAECKNYSKRIALQTIAPTLIMAELCNADEIYFFSYSLINDNVKRKLCYYAYINHKKIRFYDDIALEQLIFYNQFIYNKYFGSYTFSNVDFSKDAIPKVLYNCLRNPFLNYKKDEVFFNKSELPEFRVNEIISLQICAINNNLLKSALITIKIEDTKDDLQFYELLDQNKRRSEIQNYKYSDEIKPNEIFFHSVDFKIIKYKKQLNLPKLIVTVTQDERNQSYELPWTRLECRKIKRAEFIGPFYHDILAMIEMEMVNNSVLSGFLLKGSSGTGKSRILEESLAVFIKYDYKVLNFIGEENDSGKNIIREIIYVLFEVSEELIFESYTLSSNASPALTLAFNMLLEINNPNADIISIIDKYGIIIFEKLMSNKYVLVIDNLQYFDKSLIYFLEKLISYSKNCNRKNMLFLALSINTDYLYKDSEASKIKNQFHYLDSTSVCYMKNIEVKGFETEGSSLEFIKQLLNIKNDCYDLLLKKVISKASYKPYYIESIVENLYQFESVKYTDEGFSITDISLFQSEIESLPADAEEKLTLRWKFFCKHIRKKEYYIQILSIIHVFGACNQNLIQTLNLNNKFLQKLCEYNFIKIEYGPQNIYYVFTHDLMESYFCKNIPEFDSYAYQYLISLGYEKVKHSYPVIYNLCKLYITDYDCLSLENVVKSGANLDISYKIFWDYYHSCLIALLNSYEDFSDKSKWYSLCLFSGIQIKKRLGNNKSLFFFKQLFEAFEEDTFEEKYNYKEFADILFFYGEIKQQLTFYNDVISLYLTHLNEYEQMIQTAEKNEDISSTIAFIYNRLSVAYKHLPGDYNRIKQMRYIDLSLKLSRNLTNRQYLAENCYDKGSYYYYHKKYKNKVVSYWKSCCNLIEKYKIELMTLHYVEHRIQINLINQELNNIPHLLEFGRDYLKHGKYSEQSIYFKRFFDQAEAVYWLMEKRNFDKVKELLDWAEEDIFILGKNNLTYINYLRGKLYFYLKDEIRCYQFYTKAYEEACKLTILYKDDFINMLIDDMLLKFKLLNLNEELFTNIPWYDCKHRLRAEQIQQMTDGEFQKYYDNYQASSIIMSLDKKENFPHI